MTIVDKNYSIAAMINESKQLLNGDKCSTYMYMILQYNMTAYSKMKASQIISVFSQGEYSGYDIIRDIQLSRIRKECISYAGALYNNIQGLWLYEE